MRICTPEKPCGVFSFGEVFKLSPEELRKLAKAYNGLRILRVHADKYRLAPPESPEGRIWKEFSDKLEQAGIDLWAVEDYWLTFYLPG